MNIDELGVAGLVCKNVKLRKFVDDDVQLGCRDVSSSLGIQKMPFGYALMLDADEMYHYFLRHDGKSSAIHWDKWAVYRWAKQDELKIEGGYEHR